MTAVPVAQRMTVEEFRAGADPLDPRRIELVDGEVVVSEPASLHDGVQREILFALECWVRAAPGRGRATQLAFGLDRHNFFVPDIAWYREPRIVPFEAPQPYPLCDLAVEVRSPSTWRYDIGAKKAAYERNGLSELWLADTAARVIIVFRRSSPDRKAFDAALELDRDATLTSPLLPGFVAAVGGLFPEGC